MMSNRKFLAVLAVLGLAFLAIASGGGCDSSSSSGASARNQFIDAVGTVVDDLQAIADSAVSNRKVITAINDIVGQYLVSDGDATVRNRAIGRTFMADDIVIQDLTGNPVYDKAVFVKVWSNKHIAVRNNEVETFVTGQNDFQLTITGSDGHVTKLTITPNANTGYWQAFAAVSAILNSLYGEDLAGQVGEQHNYLVFAYAHTSANLKVEYDGTTLLDGAVSLSYPDKPADSMSAPVYLNTPHTTTYALTLYPQDNKAYTVGIDLKRVVASTGADSLSSNADLSLYRKAGSATRTILALNAGMNATVPSNAIRPSAASLTALDLNIADRIRLAEKNPLDLVSLMGLYVTGTDATEETIKSNVASINTLLSNAGLSVYLNKSASKAGDVRALAGKIGGYNHVRFGIQFNGASEPELVREIVNPDDLAQLKTLVGRVSAQVQALTQLLTGAGILGDAGSNEIVQLIFNDLFGTN